VLGYKDEDITYRWAASIYAIMRNWTRLQLCGKR